VFCERPFAWYCQQPVKDKQILVVVLQGKISADVHGMHWVRSSSWVIKRGGVWLILLSHSKTINAKIISFADLYTKRSNQKALQFWCVVNSLKYEKPVKECFGIQARGPQNREVPGICPVCPMVNPALTESHYTTAIRFFLNLDCNFTTINCWQAVLDQDRIQPVRLGGGAISLIFGNHIW